MNQLLPTRQQVSKAMKPTMYLTTAVLWAFTFAMFTVYGNDAGERDRLLPPLIGMAALFTIISFVLWVRGTIREWREAEAMNDFAQEIIHTFYIHASELNSPPYKAHVNTDDGYVLFSTTERNAWTIDQGHELLHRIKHELDDITFLEGLTRDDETSYAIVFDLTGVLGQMRFVRKLVLAHRTAIRK